MDWKQLGASFVDTLKCVGVAIGVMVGLVAIIGIPSLLAELFGFPVTIVICILFFIAVGTYLDYREETRKKQQSDWWAQR